MPYSQRFLSNACLSLYSFGMSCIQTILKREKIRNSTQHVLNFRRWVFHHMAAMPRARQQYGADHAGD